MAGLRGSSSALRNSPTSRCVPCPTSTNAPPEPGSDVVVIKPRPGGGLTQAATRHLTTHGEVGVEWTRRGTDFTIDVDVP
ncbi:MAG: hypothetical protein J0I18_20760, partial [Actinobacteria bacterium]|nr:hypothetical protein [Actinomycetota bacterium]